MANPVQKVNLHLYKNSTYRHMFMVQNGAGAPVDLTGYAARLDMRANSASDPALFEADDTDYLHIYTADGYVLLEIPATIIEAWDFDTAMYDLVIQAGANPAASVCIARGMVTVHPHITDI